MTNLPKLLHGEGAFVKVPRILEALTLQQVSQRPPGAPHSLYEELWHLVYWQDFLLERAQGRQPKVPAHAGESWPGRAGPESEAAWQRLVADLMRGLDTARDLAREPGRTEELGEARTPGGVLETLAVHNAYHFGRMVLLRQLMGLWPPERGDAS